MQAKNGVTCAPNIPTEEMFTMPDRNRTNGRACFTKPVSLFGNIIENLVVEFVDGRVVHVDATSGRTVFEEFLNSDEGAKYLGEVALVPNSSPISQSGVLFLNTLFDENAASHIAFGSSYAMNLDPEANPEKAGANQSSVHMDCMIGDNMMSVDGVAEGGGLIPLMRKGEFVF